MSRLSFSLRDVFWLTLVVAMGVAWWLHCQKLDHSRKLAERQALDAAAQCGFAHQQLASSEVRYTQLEGELEKMGLVVTEIGHTIRIENQGRDEPAGQR